MKRTLLLFAAIVFCAFSTFSQQETIFTESMGTVSGTTSIINHNDNDGFDNNQFTMSDGEAENPADIRQTSISSGYANASGGANVWFASTAGERGFSIENINAEVFVNLELQFGYRKETGSGGSLPDLSVDFWDGTDWVNVPYTFNETEDNGAGWYLSPIIELPAEAQIDNLKLRWIKAGSTAVRIDDVVLTGEISPTAPIINVNPQEIAELDYVEGQGPSDVQSFSIGGDNLTEDILLTIPADFELSLSNDPFMPEVADIVLQEVAGSVDEIDIFVRLTDGLSENSYSEVISATSSGAITQNISLSGTVFTNEPIVFITYPEEGEIIFENNITVEFSVLNFDVGTEGKVAYKINEEDFNYQESIDPISFTDLDLGENVVMIELVDMSNESLDPPVYYSQTFYVVEEGFPVNGSFEIWIEDLPFGWLGVRSSISENNVIEYTESAQDGEKACQLIETTDSHKRFTTQTLNVIADAEYEITFWVRGKGEIRTGLYDGRPAFSGYAPYNDFIEIDSWEWSEHTQTITALETTDQAEFIFSIINTDEEKDHLQLDNVSITEILSEPNIVITSPENFSTVSESDVSIEFEVSNFILGTHGKIKYSVNMGEEQLHSTTDPILLTDLAEDTYHVIFELVDMEENSLEPEVITELTFTVEYPSTDPHIVILYPQQGDYIYSSDIEVEFEVNNFELGTEGYLIYTLNENVPLIIDNEDPIQVTGLEVGEHTITMELVDLEENPLVPDTEVQISFTLAESIPGGMETFDNLTISGSSYSSGSFLGQDGSQWTFVECRGDYEITGKAIMLGRNRTPQSYVESGTINGGVGIVNFDYMQAFSNNVNLNILVNDVVVGNVTSNDEQGVIKNSGDIIVNTTGDFKFKFISENNSDGQVVIDNVSWTGFIGTEPYIFISSPQNNSTVYNDNVDVVFTIHNFELGVEGQIMYSVNGGDPEYHSSTSAISLTGLEDGNYEVDLELVDMEDNPLEPGVSATVNFDVVFEELNFVSIFDIQYTEDPDGASPYEDQEVATSGIVTGTHDSKFWIQDGEGEWSGLYIYNTSLPAPSMGDSVLVVGTVIEHYGLTQISSLDDIIVISSGNDIPNPTIVSTGEAKQEKFESVLVTVQGVCTDDSAGFGMWTVNDGSGNLFVDKLIYEYDEPIEGHLYSITGIMYFAHSSFRIEPRDIDDIIDLGELVAPYIGINHPEFFDIIYTSNLDVEVAVSNFDLGTEGMIAYQINEEDIAYTTELNFTISGLDEGINILTVELVDMEENSLEPIVMTFVEFFVNLSGPEFTDIYDIQYTESPGGSSPLENEVVWVKGVVSANFNESVHKEGYYLQQGGGAWNGLYVFDSENSPQIGDSVSLRGTVKEHHGMTRLEEISNFTIFDVGGTVADAVVLPTGDVGQEKYESVLVKVYEAEALTSPSFGEWLVDDGSGELFCKENGAFVFEPVVGNIYDIKGVVAFGYGNFTLNYRIASDITDVSFVDDKDISFVSVYPNPATDIVFLNADKNIETLNFINAHGQTVKTVAPNDFNAEINIENLAAGVYFIQVISTENTDFVRITIK